MIQNVFNAFNRIYISIWWYSSKAQAEWFTQNDTSVKSDAICLKGITIMLYFHTAL